MCFYEKNESFISIMRKVVIKSRSEDLKLRTGLNRCLLRYLAVGMRWTLGYRGAVGLARIFKGWVKVSTRIL